VINRQISEEEFVTAVDKMKEENVIATVISEEDEDKEMDNASSLAKLRESRLNSETGAESVVEGQEIPISIFATSLKVIKIMRKTKPMEVTGGGL